jgi:rhodanese-related sulfurtransferase
MKFRTALIALLLGFSTIASADFKGDIDPITAFDWLNADDNVILLDVRTAEEWRWVGHPGPNGLADSNGKGLAYNSGVGLDGKVVNISSRIAAVKEATVTNTTNIYYTNYGDEPPSSPLPPNPDFVTDVLDKYDPTMTTLLVICRSGSRSTAAAKLLADEGFDTWSVDGGFEGTKNTSEHPGPDTEYRDVNGWKNAKLPWNQSASGAYNKVLIVKEAE